MLFKVEMGTHEQHTVFCCAPFKLLHISEGGSVLMLVTLYFDPKVG